MRGLMRRVGVVNKDERGIFLLIMVISMSVLFGLLALTVDVGGLLTLRRTLVRGADAAALAGAQECAKDTPANVNARVSEYATLNVSGSVATNTGCVGNSITVTVTKTQPLDFAPLIGGANSNEVSATATAKWGAGLSGPPEPFGLSRTAWETCFVPTPPEGTFPTCTFETDPVAKGAGSNQWGGLDLDLWGVDTCPPGDPGHNPVDWVPEGFRKIGKPIPLTVDPIKYVCADGGKAVSIWQLLNKPPPEGALGTTQVFAVYDGGLIQTTGPFGDKYQVVGLTKLKVVGADTNGSPPNTKLTITLQWQGVQFSPGVPGGGSSTFGLKSIALVPTP